MDYAAVYRRSVADAEIFWRDQTHRVDWHRPCDQVCDTSNPPFARWFVGGQINLCHNAVDRHVPARPDQPALIHVSTETGREQVMSYGQLHVEVQRMAAVLQSMGVSKGDRVLIYMPMIPQAVIAMLATVRIGAIHCVVFGGFASQALATRIDDAQPTVIVTADAGSRGGKVIPYKPLLDEALRLSQHKVAHVVLVNRGLAPAEMITPRDVDYALARKLHMDAMVPCEWVESTHPSYILYTSGTTGKPKDVQRDTGGYAVALAASMEHIYQGKSSETFFCASDIGWVVGHSYIVYGPLLMGMSTIIYEGTPTRPDASIWWSLVEKYKVSVMFTAPTAIRALKKHDAEGIRRHDLSSLKHLFLAGEPLDEPTAKWIGDATGKPVIDNYWQTETGWPILSLAHGIQANQPSKLGSPGVPMVGYKVKLLNEQTGEELTLPHQKGVLAIEYPLPPGCMQTVWGNDQRFVNTYWKSFGNRLIYNTFDWATRDEAGYYYILGRTDDVINAAGHRMGTREVEEAISYHPMVTEVAVIGVADSFKGQVAKAFVVPSNLAVLLQSEDDRHQLESEILQTVDRQLGAIARPVCVLFVSALPKTRSGKLMRRVVQAVCERRDTGDLTTIEDPTALLQLQEVVNAAHC